jgi:hypothetical protein
MGAFQGELKGFSAPEPGNQEEGMAAFLEKRKPAFKHA